MDEFFKLVSIYYDEQPILSNIIIGVLASIISMIIMAISKKYLLKFTKHIVMLIPDKVKKILTVSFRRHTAKYKETKNIEEKFAYMLYMIMLFISYSILSIFIITVFLKLNFPFYFVIASSLIILYNLLTCVYFLFNISFPNNLKKPE